MLDSDDLNQGLLDFIADSPTAFHAVSCLAALLEQNGYSRLNEADQWKLAAGDCHYVIRNDSAIIAFKVGYDELIDSGLRLTGAHTDSPCLKLKPDPVIRQHGYIQLGVEVYGGALLNPWFDRDLSLAGRVNFRNDDGSLDDCLIDFREPIAVIPSLAIHLDRTVNDGKKLNAQTDLPAILCTRDPDDEFSFDAFLLEQVRQQPEFEKANQILSHELLLYDTQLPALTGLKKEFIASARLDNLLSCYLACQSLIDSGDNKTCFLVCNDHEEVGSMSATGALGPFLRSVLKRLVSSQSNQGDAFERVIQQSLLLSVDNAHGVHPNFSDRHDGNHQPQLNKGPVIKINANQRYASNSHSIARFKALCEDAGVSHQSFVMRSDMACGSTIGPLTAAELGINTIDIGLATFAMHSIRELAGANDPVELYKVLTAFYNSRLR